MRQTSVERHLLSHTFRTENINHVIEEVSSRIKQQGDKPHVTVKEQLELLEQLSQFDLGQFLLLNRGLNGYWTHYILTHPWFSRRKERHENALTVLEQFLLDCAPVLLATQQRFEVFLHENQKMVRPGAKLACIPSGMMGELLYLKFDNIDTLKLVGIDYDESALKDAESLADKLKLRHICEFRQGDAWEMKSQDEFDLISSNGLNIYEPDSTRVTELYRKFYHALKPDGKLVTSFLTPPPALSESCEWDMTAINQEDLLKQKIIFSDILEVKWHCFCSSDQITEQLKSVGFDNIEFIYDQARIFPTVVAYKK